jgi:hypothetical protein
VTAKGNGRFTRTIVNRLWQRLMGRGLIEPVDEMDNKPWNGGRARRAGVGPAQALRPEEDDRDDRAARAYQLPAVPAAEERRRSSSSAGPTVRRMTAEQFVDSIATVTGVWPDAPAANISARR